MQPTTNSLIMASRKASKLLLRDFHELEMLQNSSKGTLEFCNKSLQRTKTLLNDELQKNWKNIVFADEKFSTPTDRDIILFVHPLEAIGNLSKSLPFFAMMITVLKKNNDSLIPTCSIIIFPALHEIYYAENGGGAWCEKSSLESSGKNARLRISGCSILENSYIASDRAEPLDSSLKNIRVSGSYAYDLCLLASGKVDAVCFASLNPILRPGFELFVKEIGGFNYRYNDGMIASNQTLGTKLKATINKN